MSPARRAAHRRTWPANLYEPRPGFYIWRHPITRKDYPIGRVPLAVAKNEAIAANQHIADEKPGLVEQIKGATNTVADVLARMKPAKAANTAKTWRSLDNAIRKGLGDVELRLLTVERCATFIEGIADTGKKRWAEAVRSRLIRVCRRAVALGWIDANPAQVTDAPDVIVKRGRLTLDAFHAIYAAAPKVNDWLQRAMLFGLVLGADRMTIAGLQRSNVANGLLTYRRAKTGAWIAVPLVLRMDAVGVSLADLVNERSPVLSPYLLHHKRDQGQARAGAPVHPDTISEAFTAARKLAGIADDGAPTFHELRSLCKRTYEAQGGVDTKALLGHAGERVAELYANPRGVEPVKVRIG